jgi:hypothetical protein
MSDCCAAAKNTASCAPVVCRVCQTKGSAVEELTIKALLTEHALRRFESGSYRFCADESCDVVYFSETGATFTTEDIRVAVWHKEPPGHRLICYCFDETEAAIATELRRMGQSYAVERVRAHIAAQRCACEVRNPRGVCCLGDVIAAVERMRAP